MSQAGIFSTFIIPPGAVVETIEGNSGGPVGPDGLNNINVIGDGITIDVAGNPGTNTLTISSIAAIASSFDTDSGAAAPAAGILNIIADNATFHAGSSVSFSGSGNSVLLNVSDSRFNTIIGKGSGSATLVANENVVLGAFSGLALIAAGGNTVVGSSSLQSLTNGNNNTIIGSGAAPNYIGNESSNIIIGHSIDGVNGESNTLRIGNGSGTGAGALSRCFIAGINGVNVGSVATVVTENANQLGTAALTAGTGITITPGANTITIASTGSLNLAYTNVNTPSYTVLSTDDYLSVDCSGGAKTVRLPDAATSGRTFVIKDRTGSAATNNITVTTVGGAVNIDGATSFVMNTAYQSISIMGNGTSYEIY